MSDQQPQLDLPKIAFPTDRLSIQDLRKLFPHRFDKLNQSGEPAMVQYFQDASSSGSETLIWMLNREREIAGWAFNLALGRPAAQREDENNPEYQRSVKEEFAQSLIDYGLASGPHHAEQQIRDIEAQAIDQAKAFGPPSRT